MQTKADYMFGLSEQKIKYNYYYAKFGKEFRVNEETHILRIIPGTLLY